MKKIDQLWVLVSLELNVIETNQFFLLKEGVNRIRCWGIKKGPNWIENFKKTGVTSQRNLPTMPTLGVSSAGAADTFDMYALHLYMRLEHVQW